MFFVMKKKTYDESQFQDFDMHCPGCMTASSILYNYVYSELNQEDVPDHTDRRL